MIVIYRINHRIICKSDPILKNDPFFGTNYCTDGYLSLNVFDKIQKKMFKNCLKLFVNWHEKMTNIWLIFGIPENLIDYTTLFIKTKTLKIQRLFSELK